MQVGIAAKCMHEQIGCQPQMLVNLLVCNCLHKCNDNLKLLALHAMGIARYGLPGEI